MTIYLETERIVLRQFNEDDADNLFALDSDPEVMRYLDGGLPPDLEIIRYKTLPRFLNYHCDTPHYGFWAAIEKSTGDFLGWFHFRPALHHIDQEGEIELGYRLKRSAWGKGYATEVSRALLNKGFLEMDVRCITATALAANTASIRVMEKAGLRFVRSFIEERFPGDDQRAVKYALDRSDYIISGYVIS
jgi:RimJ/RimL family protein N-acetyltransferase